MSEYNFPPGNQEQLIQHVQTWEHWPPVLQTKAVEYRGHRASKSETTILKASDKFRGIAVHNALVWFSEYML